MRLVYLEEEIQLSEEFVGGRLRSLIADVVLHILAEEVFDRTHDIFCEDVIDAQLYAFPSRLHRVIGRRDDGP